MNHIELVIVLIFTISRSVQPVVQTCGNLDPQLTVEDAFREAGLLYDLSIRSPDDGMGFIEVTYMKNKSVSCGTQMSITETLLAPQVKYIAEPGKLYTFMLIDVDVPSPYTPFSRALIHWMVINVPNDDVNSGAHVIPYVNPMPPPFLGPHRYIFLTYEQPERMQIDFRALLRTNFNVSSWSKARNLYGPIAGNYFVEETLSFTRNRSPVNS